MIGRYEFPMLPPVHAGMFKQEGYVHINIWRLNSAPQWKAELWIDSILWFAKLNDMDVTKKEVKHGVIEFNWEPR